VHRFGGGSIKPLSSINTDSAVFWISVFLYVTKSSCETLLSLLGSSGEGNTGVSDNPHLKNAEASRDEQDGRLPQNVSLSGRLSEEVSRVGLYNHKLKGLEGVVRQAFVSACGIDGKVDGVLPLRLLCPQFLSSSSNDGLKKSLNLLLELPLGGLSLSPTDQLPVVSELLMLLGFLWVSYFILFSLFRNVRIDNIS